MRRERSSLKINWIEHETPKLEPSLVTLVSSLAVECNHIQVDFEGEASRSQVGTSHHDIILIVVKQLFGFDAVNGKQI